MQKGQSRRIAKRSELTVNKLTLRLSESNAKLVWTLPSDSKVIEDNIICGFCSYAQPEPFGAKGLPHSLTAPTIGRVGVHLLS